MFRHEGRGHAWGIGQQFLTGIVVGYRIGKHRDLGNVGGFIDWNLIKAKMGDHIGLDNRIVGIIAAWGR